MKVNVVLAAIAAIGIASGAQANLAATANGPSFPAGSGTDGTQSAIVSVNISGVESWDALGSPNNTILLVDMAAALGYASGTSITMVSIGWDTIQTAFGDSWLSEMRIYFDDNINPDNSGLFLRPGSAVTNPNGNQPMAFSSGGMIDLTANAIPNIVLPNGILRLDFHETFDDVAGAIDGVYNSLSLLHIGTLEAAVPAPGALALLGLAGLVGGSRRRR